MKTFIIKHKYSFFFTVLTLILICFELYLLYKYNNSITEYEPRTYEEFEPIINEIKGEQRGFVSLEFICSEESIDGEVKYKYKIYPITRKINITSSWEKYLYEDDGSFNEYILSNRKLDIEQDRAYEANYIITAIEYPKIFYHNVPISFEDLLTNEETLIDGYINITIPKFEKKNIINYNFIEIDLKQNKYESYIETLNEINQDIIQNHENKISIGYLWVFCTCLIALLCVSLIAIFEISNL